MATLAVMASGCDNGEVVSTTTESTALSATSTPAPDPSVSATPSGVASTLPPATSTATDQAPPAVDPLVPGPVYDSSIRSPDVDFIDFITDDDPSTFACREYRGQRNEEMLLPDDEIGFVDSYVYDLYFSDGTELELIIAPEVGDESAADEVATAFEGPLGALPTKMRSAYKQVKIYGSSYGPSSEPDGGWFYMGVPEVQERLDDNDLHETVFHESVHMSFDAEYASTSTWKQAQAADGQFLTRYAAEFPEREDLAETALFAYTYIHHPERLGSAGEVVPAVVPNRLAFFETVVFPADKPLIESIGPEPSCGKAG